MKACQQGYRMAFPTAQEWVSRLEGAQDRNQLEAELRRLERYHLLVVDEVGYLRSSDPRPTSSSRSSPAATSAARSPSPRRGFEQWGEILGDAMVAAALIDRLVHHATMITLKGQELPATRAGSGRRARRSGSVAPRLRLSGSMSYKLEDWCTFRGPKVVHGALFDAP
jgi:DNA replication protein DnaC